MSTPSEPGLRRGTAFGLARATRRFDLLEEFDAIPFLPEPVDPVGRNIGIHNDAAPSLPGPDNNYPELVPKLGQMTTIASRNGDVEYGHLSAAFPPKILPPQSWIMSCGPSALKILFAVDNNAPETKSEPPKHG
jgi:hypothetical protein